MNSSKVKQAGNSLQQLTANSLNFQVLSLACPKAQY